MKKYIVSILLLLPLLAGCKKASGPEVKPVASGKMSFSAYSPAVKSHFNGDGPQLHWDATDKIAIYGFPVMNMVVPSSVVYSTSVSEVIGVNEISSDGKSATFLSSKTPSQWFADPIGNNLSFEGFEDFYLFYAYYPAGDTPKQILIDNSEYPRLWEYFLFNVPAAQDGINYNSYQVLYDPGFPEQEHGDVSAYVHSKSAVLAGEASISFKGLRPVTSMLRFSLATPAELSSVNISSLEIVLEGSDADNLSLTGDARLPLIHFGAEAGVVGDGDGDGDEDDENDEMVPYSYDSGKYGEYLFATEGGHNALTITFASPLEITPEKSDYLYAVILPLRTQASDLTVRFVATDTNGGQYISRASLPAIPVAISDGDSTPSAPYYGFKGGYRYKSDITLNQPAVFEAGNAGSYVNGPEM